MNRRRTPRGLTEVRRRAAAARVARGEMQFSLDLPISLGSRRGFARLRRKPSNRAHEAQEGRQLLDKNATPHVRAQAPSARGQANIRS